MARRARPCRTERRGAGLALALLLAGCKPVEGRAYRCTCSILTDFDDTTHHYVFACAVDVASAQVVARGCAASAAPAPVQSCTCAPAPERGVCRAETCEPDPR